jgi:hypothetical protein
VELKKLHKMLLIRFDALLQQLLSSPEENCKAKVSEIETILVNMHHLMNAYRPHQVCCCFELPLCCGVELPLLFDDDTTQRLDQYHEQRTGTPSTIEHVAATNPTTRAAGKAIHCVCTCVIVDLSRSLTHARQLDI